MIFDKLVLDFLERRVTHPIQRQYSYTNFTLAKWICIILLTAFLLVIFGLINIDPAFYSIIVNSSSFCKFIIAVACGAGVYMVGKGFSIEEARALKNAEQGLMNPKKIELIWQLVRMVAVFSALISWFMVIHAFSFEVTMQNLGSVTTLTTLGVFVFANLYALAFYLFCLDPIPRSKERTRIPKGARTI